MESKILDSDSDEDKPLSEIRKKHVRQSLFQSDEDSNDDPLFEIKDVDINSTDSEYEDIIKDVKRNSKMKGVTRDKAWKRKPSTMTNKKRNTPGWPKKSRERFTCKAKSPLLTKKRKILLGEKHSNIGSKANKHGISTTKKRDIHIHQYSVEKAKQESMRQQRALVILQRFHERTLDTLLNSNGLQRYSIPRNGNCFFEAIVKSSNLTKFKSHKELRESLCDYMCANKHCFTPFLTMSDEEYFQQVEYLRKDGNWSNDLADSLPLAAANVLGRDFKIFTSDRKQPIIQVTSSVRTSDTNDIKNHMALGYIKMRGVEHYDACFPKESRIQTPAKPKCIEPVPNITPRKQACYISPVHKKRTRKRKANPEMWKKNIRKRLRLSGKSYISSLGKEKPEKSVKVVNCSKCRFKCTLHISHQQRECIFNNFWGLGSYERQKDFLCSNIKESSPKRVVCKAKSHRSASRIFSFSADGIDNVRVCKSFFLKTLDVSERSIESAMKNKEAGVFVSYDGRGKHTPHNKIPDNIIEGVRRHIESFPTVEAHYTRKQTNKLYLEPDLNISKMYDLYKESCQNKGAVAVSKIKYRKIFCEEYNISFHKPKKDQCQVCAVYQDAKLKGTTSHEMDLEFSEHQRKKERARQEKELDKQFAKEHSNYHSAVFDLEAVLPVPCSLVSQVYYKRKLSCYNLSVFSLQDAKTSCYLWNESEGNRGSCEIASCLQMYLRSLPDTVSHVSLFSDSCSGQNRNRIMATSLLHAVNSLKNISVIDQKFLESGHTQMEVDSVHAAIERAKKATSVYVPSQWDTVIRLARRKKPYSVIPLKYTDFVDFKSVSNNILPCNVHDCSGHKALWMKMKWIQYRKREPDSIFFKYEFDSPEFTSIKIRKTRSTSAADIQGCYSEKLPISDAKKSDLISLCKSGIIPTEFHAYYENMRSFKDECNKTANKGDDGETDEEWE